MIAVPSLQDVHSYETVVRLFFRREEETFVSFTDEIEERPSPEKMGGGGPQNLHLTAVWVLGSFPFLLPVRSPH